MTPLIIENTVIVNDDHVSTCLDISDEAFAEAHWEFSKAFGLRTGGRARPATISLAEHAMIAYFRPAYNQKLKTWSGQRKSPEMELMWRAGARLATVQVQGAHELARFMAPDGTLPRSHTIMCEVPADPREHGFGAVAPHIAPQTSEFDGYPLILDLNRTSQERNELSPPLLNVFGDPPSIATPPDVRSWLNAD
ncbi:hypothetical protein ACIGB8_01495 [Promicromonospora sukumoe]|uniref:hypothetical protein n=1 Tax=Promicromonospora sukumoe TaxID=88382 RepID=UPI0037C92D1D